MKPLGPLTRWHGPPLVEVAAPALAGPASVIAVIATPNAVDALRRRLLVKRIIWFLLSTRDGALSAVE
jgi:hypothetical protein